MKSSSQDYVENTTLQILNNIKRPEKFSKYSKNIDRAMKNYSLESIKEKLSKKKLTFNISIKGTLRSEDINRNKKLQIFEEKITEILKSSSTSRLKTIITKNENLYPSILPSFRSNDEENRDRTFKEQERLEAIEYYQKIKKEKIERKIKEKYYPMPEPGKYTPNYNAITKHSYGVNFETCGKVLPVLGKFNESSRNKNELLDLNYKTQNLSEESGGNFLITSLKTTNEKYNNTSISSHSSKHEYLQTSPIRGVKFESYSARKELNKTKKSVILSYLEPSNYKVKTNKNKVIKGIKIDKSLGHSNPHIMSNNNFPSPCDYSPNYNSIQNKITKKILFTEEIDLDMERKKLIKKVLYNYKPTTEYNISRIKKIIQEKANELTSKKKLSRKSFEEKIKNIY